MMLISDITRAAIESAVDAAIAGMRYPAAIRGTVVERLSRAVDAVEHVDGPGAIDGDRLWLLAEEFCWRASCDRRVGMLERVVEQKEALC